MCVCVCVCVCVRVCVCMCEGEKKPLFTMERAEKPNEGYNDTPSNSPGVYIIMHTNHTETHAPCADTHTLALSVRFRKGYIIIGPAAVGMLIQYLW